MVASEQGSASRTDSRDEISILVEELHVEYRVYEEQRLNARDMLHRGFRPRRQATVRAIRGVTFSVPRGQAVGIIGSNGSGKSTLLRTIAGLQARSSGTVLVSATPQLLGVNAALKPELSGYRNVMLGGLAMGLAPDEIEARLPDIEQFSELGDAMGRPLKTFSSGMRARLAFSVATLRVPEILLVDEALAVGDRQFRKKSLERIRAIRDQAGTVLMVTHNLNEVRQTCARAIWLDHGVIVDDGETEAVLARYEAEDEAAVG